MSRKLFAAVLVVLMSASSVAIVSGAGTEEGKASARDVILVHDVYELQNMSLDLNGSYELANDIDASATVTWNDGKGFAPVGNDTDSYFDYALQRTVYVYDFNGRFDGAGYTISGLHINRNAEALAGLIGNANVSAAISNVSISDCTVTGYNSGGLVGMNYGAISNCRCTGSSSLDGGGFQGGLVGVNLGTITGCSVTGSVDGKSRFGGLVGHNEYKGTISNCYIYALVSGNDGVGGLAGNNSGTISDCHLTGSVKGTTDVGGLIAAGYGIISNCSSSGDVSGVDYIGGIVASSGDIRGCYNTGNVTGSGEPVGGVIADNWKGTVYECYNTGSTKGKNRVGGLIGDNYGNISKCYSTGPVSGTDKVGGLVGENSNDYGWMGIITDSYSTGDVTGSDQVGGLVGYHFFKSWPSGGWGAYISKCYSAGLVQGVTNIGGLAGKSESNITDCYWDNQTSGRPTDANGTGKNTTEMMLKATFVNWDFTNIWNIDETVTYPYLRDMPVGPENRAPTITTVPPTTATAGSIYSVQFAASDPDGDALSWNGTPNASWLSMTAGGLLSGTPSGSDIGTFTVAITVIDGKGGSASITFELSVSPASNHDPVWSAVPSDTNLTEGDGYNFTARATDSDAKDTVVYGLRAVPAGGEQRVVYDDFSGALEGSKWTLKNRGGMGADVASGVFSSSGTSNAADYWKANSWLESTQAFPSGFISGELRSFSGTGTGYHSELLLWADPAGDEENNYVGIGPGYDYNIWGSKLMYRSDCYLNGIPQGTRWYEGAGTGVHTYQIWIISGNAYLFVDGGLLDIRGGFDGFSAPKAMISTNARATADTVDASWDNITTVPYDPLPAGLVMNATSGAIAWPNATVGDYRFNLTASNGHSIISHLFQLSVTKKPVQPLGPSIVAVTGPENVTVKAASVQTFSVEATSPSNVTLTYEWKDNGATVSTEKSFSRKFAPGNHTLILLIGDGRYTATRTFNFTVAPAPKTIEPKPVSIPGFEAGVAAAAVVVVVTVGLFWRRERR